MPPKKRPGRAAAAAAPIDIPALQAEYDTHLQRKVDIEHRLQVISLPPAPTKTSSSTPTFASATTTTSAAAAAAAAASTDGGATAVASSSRRRIKKGPVENENEQQQVGGDEGSSSVANSQQRPGSAVAAAAASGSSSSSIVMIMKRSNNNKIPIVKEKTDTHWDFVLKEMQWLATDFASERKRHCAGRRKLCNSLQSFGRQRQVRALQALQVAEGKRRKLAAKLGRDILKTWWNKIDKVVTFRQKLVYDQQRRHAMNRQLLRLVKQTELYTESLAQHAATPDDQQQDDDDNDDDDNDDSSSPKRAPRRNRRKRRPTLTIEQALAKSSRRRNVLNYATLNIIASDGTKNITSQGAVAGEGGGGGLGTEMNDDDDDDDTSHVDLALLYHGESTASDTGGSGYDDDESYQPPASSEREFWDDETTLQQAEVEEQRERRQLRRSRLRAGNSNDDEDDDDDENEDGSFVADPLELQKLEEEQTMDINDVLERLRQEGLFYSADTNSNGNDSDGNGDDDADTPANAVNQEQEGEEDVGRTKRVQFADEVQVHPVVPMEQDAASSSSSAAAAAVALPKSDPGEDADDDGDASDVEDFVDAMQVDHDIDGPTRASAAAKRLARAKADQDDDDDDAVDNDDDDDEFLVDESAPLPVDDETTMEEEEQLPQEMSVQEEIQLLQREGEMPVEELRRLYAGALSSSLAAAAAGSSDDDDDDVEKDDSKPPAMPPPRRSKRRTRGKKLSPQPPAAEATVTGAAAAEEEEEEYQVKDNDADAVDDETTMEAEEKLGREMSYEEELALLQNENEIPIEQLRAMYADALNQGNNSSNSAEDDDDDDETNEDQQDSAAAADDQPEQSTETTTPSLAASLAAAANDNGQEEEEEFQPNAADEVDDETTMEAEEKLGRDMSYEDEINLLKRESEMSVEELRAMYAGMNDDEEEEEEEEEEEIVANPDEDKDTESKRKRDEADATQSMKKIKADTDDEETAQAGKAALDALEASAERAKNTLASRPYLLSNWVKLRKYQQIGLNWLVSLQSRRLNGILADEMGLGKTLQTISLLAYLAAYKGIWGPHLIIVPTSVIINWETELKRFAPAFKVLCYYGPAKRRKELRQGWTKSNWYHVVITSYQLACQDAFAFKRKRWYYLVLDEAQNIKNFQSQRWQTLITFNTQRRLLLTGTPLQNSILELWSLLNFIMPQIFRSRRDFSHWFADPMNGMIEGSAETNNDMIGRLHTIIRPFVLRRLKSEVETQMPGKFEHIVKCQLSRRQMLIYEEFMARSSTRQALKKSGNFMGMMNVLMQLRKVCNHPDLFEARSVVTPFVLDPISIPVPSCVFEACSTPGVFRVVSEHLRIPLWCGSGGDISLNSGLRHDDIESEQLRQLETSLPLPDDAWSLPLGVDKSHTALTNLLHEQWKARSEEKTDRVRFLNGTNSRRCRAPPSVLSDRLIDAVSIPRKPLDQNGNDFIMSTPQQFFELRRSQQQRAEDLDDMIKKFVCCVPKAGVRRSAMEHCRRGDASFSLDQMLLEPLEEYHRPFREAHARLSSFFPDKKLIQFDSGKLQTLAALLRELKKDGHRCLIFTQMSKMLDILEAFLNLNAHTYLRLDGSTGVERRQRLMDRFNNDTKMFCFILSTRSGGLGINLTGADTVIFYDSDWNPAMDAQAQDRAHRIGQTREVHIFRLVCEHTIEENILMKAKQKRNLDILVMDKGKFDSSHLFKDGPNARLSSESSTAPPDLYTKGGLRDILGAGPDADDNVEVSDKTEGEMQADLTKEQMESAMTSLEDADDVQALRGAQKEQADELKEFDESEEPKKEATSDGEDDADNTKKEGSNAKKSDKADAALDDEKKQEEELEKEFAAWQTKVGMDKEAIEASLTPAERYGLRYREEVDPHYSLYYFLEHKRQMMEAQDEEDEIDIAEVEREKALGEQQAMEDGDLLATHPKPEELVRQRNLYQHERARLRSNKKRRTMTGENWETRIDALSKHPFWYNTDTGEAVWDKPNLLLELEAYELANKQKWAAMPLNPLVHIMSFLIPFPDRMRCARTCRQWRKAAGDFSFVHHVYPVEMGAYTREDRKMEANHFRSIPEALASCHPGDTIELGDGHYWLNEDMVVNFPICMVGDEHNPTNVVIEMSGTIIWKSVGGWLEGITFRRPTLTSGDAEPRELLCIAEGCRLDVVHSIFDNEGSTGKKAAIVVKGNERGGHWEDVVVKDGME